MRLTPMGYALGLASEERMRLLEEKQTKTAAFVQFFKETSITPEEANPLLEKYDSSPMKQGDKMAKVLARPQYYCGGLHGVAPSKSICPCSAAEQGSP